MNPSLVSDSAAEAFAHGMPVLEAERLRLRPFRQSDAPEVFRLYADKEANRFGFSPKMDVLDDAVTLIDKTLALAAENTLFHFGAASKDDDKIIGHATLLHWERGHRRAELGYCILQDLWGQGLGTEAVNTLVRFGFERLGLRRFEADVDPRNMGSIRVLEKLGFLREGFMRERWELAGEIQDGVFFGLLRREWRG